MEHWNESLSKEQIEAVQKMMDGTYDINDERKKQRREQQKEKTPDNENTEANTEANAEANTYTLTEVFNECWYDRIKFEMDVNQDEEIDALAFERPDDNSTNRKNLNEMFEALFGCKYDTVLIKKGKSYVLGKHGKVFAKLLLKSYSSEDGKKLRKRNYEELDFQYENYSYFAY